MKPGAGGFDLRTIDDGAPAENVRSGRGKAVIVTAVIVGLAAFALGAGYGIASVGRHNMNTANHAAQTVKAELEGMQKTLTQMNILLANVISDLSGWTGQRIVRAILDGERDPVALAALSHPGIRASHDAIAKSL